MDKEEIINVLNTEYFGKDSAERDEVENLRNLLKGTQIFIDVGASLGQYTYFANNTMKNGKIYCIEPDPLRFDQLKNNCEQWIKAGSNEIVPINAAVADKQETAKFFVTQSTVSGSLFKIPERSKNWDQVDIRCITLDDLYEEGKIFFIKIDIEGGEYRAISGAKRLMTDNNLFLVELHHWGDKEFQKYPYHVIKLFTQANYHIEKTFNHYLFKKLDKKVHLPYEYYYFLLWKIYDSYFPFLKPMKNLVRKLFTS